MKISRIKKIRLLEKAIYIVGYALILIIMSMIFNDTIQIDNSYLGIWGIIISLVIYILNKTVKPIIFKLTLPITALTLGIFYPCINVFILKLTAIILGSHLDFNNFWVLLLAAILISVMNTIVEEAIIKPIIRRFKHV